MKRVFLLALLFTALLPQAVEACVSGGVLKKEDHIAKAIEDSVFIGMIEVLEIKGNKTTIKIIAPYISKKYKTGDTLIITKDEIDSCDKAPIPKGKIYEEVIYKTKKKKMFLFDKFYLSNRHRQFSKETWQQLREKLTDKSLINEKIAQCKASKGEWVQYSVYETPVVFDCFFSTNDSKNQCNDSKECEGQCVAHLTEKESDSFFTKMIETKGQKEALEKLDKSLKKSGLCSPYKSINGCKYVIKNGYVQHREVCH